MNDLVTKRYLNNDYLDENPEWDVEDSPWKAEQVISLLEKNTVPIETICEVGCGAGQVLAKLQEKYKTTAFFGYDIAPAAEVFWNELRDSGIKMKVGDFFQLNKKKHDLILLLDVLEHVSDPHQFLINAKKVAEHVVLHFPLDLSAISVFRESPLLHVRRKVGHIHYFTKGLALELLEECGFEVVDYAYTGAAFNVPQSTLRTRLARIPRFIAYALNKDLGVRLLGGETLMVLAKPRL